MPITGLLALKLTLVPGLIVAVTLAGRRWGARVAGCLAAFPVVAGPILLFVALEQGTRFAAHAAGAAILAVMGNVGFGIAYSWMSRRQSWLVSLLTGWLAYFCTIIPLSLLQLSLTQATILTVVALTCAARMYPAVAQDGFPSAKPVSDLPYRMLAGLALVLAVTFFSNELGPKFSGLLSVFPVMGSVLAVFSQLNVSQAFAVRLLHGMVQGFYAFTGFCLVLACTLETYPVYLSFLSGLAAAVVLQLAFMQWQAWRLKAAMRLRP